MDEGLVKCSIAEYWNSSSSGYSKAIINRDVQKGKIAWLTFFDRILGQEKMEIIDVGTGPGIMALLLAELGHIVTGIDISDKMLNKAKENATNYGQKINFIYSDAEKLPFDDMTYDAVVNRHLLWTLSDPYVALMEWKRVLKPEGKLIIIDGNWHPTLEGSWKNKLWSLLSVPLIVVTERRIPFRGKYSAEVKKRLPLMYAQRPEEDLKIIEKVGGFQKITVIEKINRMTQTTLEYLKYGCGGDSFCICAEKKR
jgi:ubiquinone/menaquinone biosynthesis C-methylase UbiE